MPRLIYSLELQLAAPDGTQPNAELIAPLTPDGQSPHVRAELPTQRVIDLRVGDWCRHVTLGTRQVIGIRAYRDAWFGEGEQPDLRGGYYGARAAARRPAASAPNTRGGPIG
ncbi:MAG: hypothetical protein FJ276_26370 [Planctomycetes bacterium]|nr:hypothetical protein [Planctomycetota bacterium]